MHIKLSTLKRFLYHGVLDPSYKHILIDGQSNQRAFLMTFMPMEFLRQEDNRSIIEIRSNNSSRLSNIFNRVTEPKRNEERFRMRFLESFDSSFYKEMLSSSTFVLRNYNHEAFQLMVENILNEDSYIIQPEYSFIRNYIINNADTSPEKTLTMLFIWAFHIDSFDKIIKVIRKHEQDSIFQTSHKTEDAGWSDLIKFLKSLNLDPKHIQDYMKIVTVYGISGQIGAIALRTYLEKNIDVNPLIYCEVANMLYSGNNYAKSQPIKALNMFSAAANTGYGAALWTMGQMTNHSRHRSNIKNAAISKEYYKKAFENNQPLSLNNLGILYHRAIVFYLARIKGYENFQDCFLHDSGSGISEIYHSIKDEKYIVELIKKFNLENFNPSPSNTTEEYECLSIIEKVENDILDNFFIPGYMEHSYFYAAGSALTIYENQFSRKNDFWSHTEKSFQDQKEYIQLKDTILTTGEYFARYYCSESHFTYGRLLEQYEPGEIQNAYEHYYIAAFDTPHKAFRFHSLLRFLELHYSQQIMNKKTDVDGSMELLNFIDTQLLPYDPMDQLVLRSIKLIDRHLNLDLHYLLTSLELGQVRENLMTEMHKTLKDQDDYNFYLKRL